MAAEIHQTSLLNEAAFHSDLDISSPKPLTGLIDNPPIAPLSDIEGECLLRVASIFFLVERSGGIFRNTRNCQVGTLGCMLVVIAFQTGRLRGEKSLQTGQC